MFVHVRTTSPRIIFIVVTCMPCGFISHTISNDWVHYHLCCCHGLASIYTLIAQLMPNSLNPFCCYLSFFWMIKLVTMGWICHHLLSIKWISFLSIVPFVMEFTRMNMCRLISLLKRPSRWWVSSLFIWSCWFTLP